MNIAETHDVLLQARGTSNGTVFPFAVLAALIGCQIEPPPVVLVTSALETQNSLSGMCEIGVASQNRKAAKFRALIENWMNDQSGYDESIWPELKTAIEADRLSNRSRF